MRAQFTREQRTTVIYGILCLMNAFLRRTTRSSGRRRWRASPASD